LRVDLAALALRLTLAWLIFSIAVLYLYLVGAAQSFLEPTQNLLFRGVRWLSWIGFLGSWFLLVPLTRKQGKRVAASLLLGLGCAILFAFVLVWGAWIYPDSGRLPW